MVVGLAGSRLVPRTVVVEDQPTAVRQNLVRFLLLGYPSKLSAVPAHAGGVEEAGGFVVKLLSPNPLLAILDDMIDIK